MRTEFKAIVQIRKEDIWKSEPLEQEISHKHSQSGH